ncbi:MAG: hypothetical protein JNN13_05050 [Planctomycetes bacterium]|nr:hypothetical protein [Planctomycetota bacterium]
MKLLRNAVGVALQAVLSAQQPEVPLHPRDFTTSFPQHNESQKQAVSRALAYLEELAYNCLFGSALSCKLLAASSKLLALALDDKIVDGLKAEAPARTLADAEGSGESVWKVEEGNAIALDRRMWGTSSGVVGFGRMGSPRLNDILLAATLRGELAHQDLRTRTDAQSNPIADPSGYPNAKSQEQNAAAFRASEVEAATAAIEVIMWAIVCADINPPPLTPGEVAKLEKVKESLESFKKENGG